MADDEPALRTRSGEPITFHPLLAKLADDGAPTVRGFSGYVGPCAREGWVTVYPSLERLDRSVEVNVADIVHVEDIPASQRPFGAKMVWVRAEADLTTRREGSMRVRAYIRRGGVESRIGRLRMWGPARSMAADDPNCASRCYEDSCFSGCSYLCTSYCEEVPTCVSSCGPPPPEAL